MTTKKIKAVVMIDNHFAYPGNTLTVLDDLGCILKIEYFSKYKMEFEEDYVNREHIKQFIYE